MPRSNPRFYVNRALFGNRCLLRNLVRAGHARSSRTLCSQVDVPALGSKIICASSFDCQSSECTSAPTLLRSALAPRLARAPCPVLGAVLGFGCGIGDSNTMNNIASASGANGAVWAEFGDTRQRLPAGPAEVIERRTCDGITEVYVHYIDCDRRLDEWVPASKVSALDPSVRSELLSPMSATPTDARTPCTAQQKMTRRLKRKIEEVHHVQQIEDLSPIDQSLEREHHEKTKVKNVKVSFKTHCFARERGEFCASWCPPASLRGVST